MFALNDKLKTMKVLVLYRPKSEHGRLIENFIVESRRRLDEASLEVLDVDSRHGSELASLYDVMQYPAILVLANDGFVQKSWAGDNIPLLDEVMGYVNA
jgi:hypothetical protein